MTEDYLEENNKYYNLTTDAYQKYWGKHFHYFLWDDKESREEGIERTNKIFLQDAELNENSKVLDLGCGIGALSLEIAETYGCEVTGVNANKKQVKIARKKAKEKGLTAEFIHEDIMELELEEEFDAAFLIDVEPHLPNKSEAIKIIKSHLKSQGKLVITGWLKREDTNPLHEKLLIERFCEYAGFPYMATFKEYENIFEEQDFKVLKFEDWTESINRCVQDFYTKAFKIMEEAPSLKNLTKMFSLDAAKTVTKEGMTSAAERAFLGPVYAKMCLDADIYRHGYFV